MWDSHFKQCNLIRGKTKASSSRYHGNHVFIQEFQNIIKIGVEWHYLISA